MQTQMQKQGEKTQVPLVPCHYGFVKKTWTASVYLSFHVYELDVRTWFASAFALELPVRQTCEPGIR